MHSLCSTLRMDVMAMRGNSDASCRSAAASYTPFMRSEQFSKSLLDDAEAAADDDDAAADNDDAAADEEEEDAAAEPAPAPPQSRSFG